MTATFTIKGFKKWALIFALCLILQKSPLRAQATAPFIVTGTGVEFEYQANGTLISTGVPSSSSLASGDQGAGTRLLWWPYQAAFRAGSVDNTQWDAENIGPYSAGFGINTTASGYGSTASGYSTCANGPISTAFGSCTSAIGANSVALGSWTTAIGSQSIAFGTITTASGYNSTASGRSTTASGYYATASGYQTSATALASFVVGSCNIGGGSSMYWNPNDPVFEVGNGQPSFFGGTGAPSDALVVYRNGNTTVSGTLCVSGSSNPILVNPAGDISMGSFQSGPQPQ